jgi:hypothetical protein
MAHFVIMQARQLASTVVQHTGHAGLQAEGLTILARAFHALGKAQEAYRYYQQVCVPAGASLAPAWTRAAAACDLAGGCC